MREPSPFGPEVDTVMRLKDEGRFSDVIIYAWARVEVYIDAMLLGQFGLHYLDTRRKENPRHGLYKRIYGKEETVEKVFNMIEFLLKTDFERKFALLKKQGLFSEEQKAAITTFQNRRNQDLFHGDLYKPVAISLSDSEKQTIMEIALKALSAVHEASVQTLVDEMKANRTSHVTRMDRT